MSIRISTSISFGILFGTLAFTACQGPNANAEQQIESKEPTAETQNTSPQTEVDEWPKLESQEQALSFLQEYGQSHPERRFSIMTDFGEIVIELYENTPLHRANMIYLIKEHQYFNGTWFHRVSPGHVIQAGNNDELSLQQKRKEIGSYQIPAEALTENYHQYGSVAMARSYKNNPQKKSDPFEFYITLGQTYPKAQLKALEKEYEIELNAEQMELYQSQGGSPHLDHEHTVIGRVVSGMKVVEEIAKVKTDRGEWPLTNIPITIRLNK